MVIVTYFTSFEQEKNWSVENNRIYFLIFFHNIKILTWLHIMDYILYFYLNRNILEYEINRPN